MIFLIVFQNFFGLLEVYLSKFLLYSTLDRLISFNILLYIIYLKIQTGTRMKNGKHIIVKQISAYFIGRSRMIVMNHYNVFTFRVENGKWSQPIYKLANWMGSQISVVAICPADDFLRITSIQVYNYKRWDMWNRKDFEIRKLATESLYLYVGIYM